MANAAKQYFVVGYKGTSPYDAGMFYCPYVPLQMVRAVGENTFQPKIGFKTRYGLAPTHSLPKEQMLHLVQMITSTTVEYRSSTLCNNKSWVNQPNFKGETSVSPFFICINSIMVQINSLQRQPTELDYADPTKFKFSINKLPKVEYFTTALNLVALI